MFVDLNMIQKKPSKKAEKSAFLCIVNSYFKNNLTNPPYPLC